MARLLMIQEVLQSSVPTYELFFSDVRLPNIKQLSVSDQCFCDASTTLKETEEFRISFQIPNTCNSKRIRYSYGSYSFWFMIIKNCVLFNSYCIFS